MEAFTKGEIVLFPFPYTDLSNRKLRPCLVLSGQMGDDLLLCQITSKRMRRDKYCVEIKKNSTSGGSLRIDSYVRSNMIFTADRSLIQHKVCRIGRKEHKKVVENIGKLIEI